MASSSTSTPTPPKKYDVFRLRGEDPLSGYTSCLYDALKRKQILTFIDNELGEKKEFLHHFWKQLKSASFLWLFFAENYASSKWCWEELVKILECRKNNRQKAVPVFYLVDLSHVRN